MSRLIKPEEIAAKFPVTAETLLAERGGQWLGTIHSFIQRKAMNGEQVIWGSNDLLALKDQTVLDLEILAASIAAATLVDARKDYEEYFQSNKPSGLFARTVHGDAPTIIKEVVRHADGSLDHSHCVGAHSWIESGITFGQGEFRSYGAWTHPCATCTAEHTSSSHDNQL